MNRSWHPLFGILSRACAALVGSAIVLIVSYVLYLESQIPADANRKQPEVIAGKNMQVVVGNAEVRGDTLVITDYQLRNGQYSAMAVVHGQFVAEKYPVLKTEFATSQAGLSLKFAWRTADNPNGFHFANLNSDGNGTSFFNLSRLQAWQGTIVEIGLIASAATPQHDLSIGRLTLEPHGWRVIVASHWSDWMAFRGWTQSSINNLFDSVHWQFVSPALVAALWSTVAFLLLLIAGGVRGWGHPGAIVAVVLIPWISLDMLWQKELNAQLKQTESRFAGKSRHDQHLADVDGPIYSYIKRLKDEVLPATASKIVLLHDSDGHNFPRLKAQYYLLPHSVYNFGRVPPDERLENTDYILVLGHSRHLEYQADKHLLSWSSGQKKIAAQKVDSDQAGRLYRVLHDPSVKEKKP